MNLTCSTINACKMNYDKVCLITFSFLSMALKLGNPAATCFRTINSAIKERSYEAVIFWVLRQNVPYFNPHPSTPIPHSHSMEF